MEYRKLGATTYEPAVIGLGTWRTFDVPLSSTRAVDERVRVVDAAFGARVNFFDSSPMYGTAEAVLGRSLLNRRRAAIVATKVWSVSVEDGRRQIKQALKYFGGWVDVYQVHNLVQWEAYLPMLSELRATGAVGAVGITHYARSSFPDMARILESEQVEVIQIPYDAAHPIESELILRVAERLNTGVIVMSPLGSGALVERSPDAKELAPLEQFGVRTWAQALLKWVVSDPRVDVVIPATSRSERAIENAQAGSPPFFGAAERERVSWLARRIAGE